MTERIKKIILLLMSLFFIFLILMLPIFKPVLTDYNSRNTYIWILLILFALLIAYLIIYVIKYLDKINFFDKLLSNKFFVFLILFCTTIIPKIIWINLIYVLPKDDFDTYQKLAIEVVNGNNVGNHYVAMFPHVIGYSTFLSFFYRIFGSNILVAQALNIALSFGIAILIYVIGTKISNKKCGLVAAVIWSLFPSQIFYTSLVCSEFLFTFLFLLCIYIFFNITDGNRKHINNIYLFVFLGFLCAITNAIRPLGAVLLLSIILFYYIFSSYKYKKSSDSLILKSYMLIILIAIYFVAAQFITFQISNAVKLKVSSFPIGFNTYVGMNIISRGEWNEQDSKTLSQLSGQYNDSQMVHNILLNKAIERVEASSPTQLLKLFIVKQKTIWSADNTCLNYIRSAWVSNLSRIDFNYSYKYFNLYCNIYYYIILILCAISVIRYIKIPKDENYYIVFLSFILLGIILVHTLSEVAGRYHFPAISIFALIASLLLYKKETDK